jgi:hypothetical protein
MFQFLAAEQQCIADCLADFNPRVVPTWADRCVARGCGVPSNS